MDRRQFILSGVALLATPVIPLSRAGQPSGGGIYWLELKDGEYVEPYRWFKCDRWHKPTHEPRSCCIPVVMDERSRKFVYV